MTTRQTLVTSSKLTAWSAVLVALTLVPVSGQQIKPPPGSDARRIRRTAPAGAALVKQQRFLEMFARAYFPGRTGQLLIVPSEGDFITRPDPDVAFMHGSPWAYGVAIPLMFAGPAVKSGAYSMAAVQQDVAPSGSVPQITTVPIRGVRKRRSATCGNAEKPVTETSGQSDQ